MLKFLHDASGWDWVDIIGIALVLLGVIGEVICDHQSFPKTRFRLRKKAFLESVENISSPGRDKWEKRHKGWVLIWGALVIIGVAMELFALPHHFKEAGEANLLAARLRDHAAGVELELAQIKNDRTISATQAEKISEILKDTPKGKVTVLAINAHPEAAKFARAINGLLASLGFQTTYDGTFINGDAEIGITCEILDASQEPPHSKALLRAMKIFGSETRGRKFPGIAENIVIIRVGPKM